jgi:hypothetical protein
VAHKEPNDYQPDQFWNSEAARKRRYADDEREENCELCQVRQGQSVRPECIKPFHGHLLHERLGIPHPLADLRNLAVS